VHGHNTTPSLRQTIVLQDIPRSPESQRCSRTALALSLVVVVAAEPLAPRLRVQGPARELELELEHELGGVGLASQVVDEEGAEVAAWVVDGPMEVAVWHIPCGNGRSTIASSPCSTNHLLSNQKVPEWSGPLVQAWVTG